MLPESGPTSEQTGQLLISVDRSDSQCSWSQREGEELDQTEPLSDCHRCARDLCLKELAQFQEVGHRTCRRTFPVLTRISDRSWSERDRTVNNICGHAAYDTVKCCSSSDAEQID